ncbi:MAG TPA: glycoside hydrolase family 38 C-terminal domain-containing protein [Anaerolineales bacterium]|nr:glycoside hydrolase family 38 C-terminal domain-containing protein [Anaerolineales bacterium]
MSQVINSSILSAETPDQQRIQCHFISNTHWDREWRYSAQRTRYMLVSMLDMLFDIFDKEPRFQSFHMDSQTLPIQDYLEACPEKEALIKKYVEAGKLVIGPWFCLPDEFIVGGESLIRNLLLGHKIARRFGPVSKTGYSPFSWGQISQMPQIYQGFGIDVASFYRGINPFVAPKSEWVWEGADGTQIIASRLGARPRYNVWYVIQRPVYWNEQNENNRLMSWGRGHGPFRFIDTEKSELDYQYAHPIFIYSEENIPARAEQALREQDPDWSTPHRFWSAGHDSSCPDIREVRLIEDCNCALSGRADVFHSTVRAWQDGLRAHRNADWPVLQGEMRHSQTKGGAAGLFGWVISSRTYIKQENFKTERLLNSYAEPLAVFASLLGAPYPQNFIDLAYNWLLQNHGHDTVAGCGRDVISDDAMYRFRQSQEIGTCILERAMIDVAGSIDLSAWKTDEMALVVYNPAPFPRTEVISTVIEIPMEWKSKNFEITDEQGRTLRTQTTKMISPFYQIVQSPNDVANLFPSSRYQVEVEFKDVPGFGYRTFQVKPVKEIYPKQPKSMLTGPLSMENEYLAVALHANGTIAIEDKVSGQRYDELGYFRDRGEVGSPWEHTPPMEDRIFTTLASNAEITLVKDGELETSFRVKIDWSLPESRAEGNKCRSSHFRNYPIINTVTLRAGQPWLEVSTEVDNTVEDHYLQVCFPTNIQAKCVAVQGQFDVIERPIAQGDSIPYTETPMTEHPMNSFVDRSNGSIGLALLNEGLKAYEAQDDLTSTIALTLIRAYPLQICVTQDMLTDYSQMDKGSQCLGKQRFRYAIFPHTGDWEKGKVWEAAERFNLAFQACQLGPTKHGTEPLTKSFLEIEPQGLHISAVKRSEQADGWVIRVFNPSDEKQVGALRLNGGHTGPLKIQSPVERVESEFALPPGKGQPWQKVRLVTLEEIPERDLTMDQDGWVKFEIGKKKILTLEFLKDVDDKFQETKS